MGEGRAAIGCDDRIDGLCRVLKAVRLDCVILMLNVGGHQTARSLMPEIAEYRMPRLR
jgi:hypothetical protein